MYPMVPSTTLLRTAAGWQAGRLFGAESRVRPSAYHLHRYLFSRAEPVDAGQVPAGEIVCERAVQPR